MLSLGGFTQLWGFGLTNMVQVMNLGSRRFRGCRAYVRFRWSFGVLLSGFGASEFEASGLRASGVQGVMVWYIWVAAGLGMYSLLCLFIYVSTFSWYALWITVKALGLGAYARWAVESTASQVQKLSINVRQPRDAAHAAFADFSDVASMSLTAGSSLRKLESVVSLA